MPSPTPHPMADDILVAEDIGLKVRESSNILLLAPSPHPSDLNICTDILAIRPTETFNIWSLGITLSADDRIAHWHDRVGRTPSEFKVVTTGDPRIHPAADHGPDGEETDPLDPEVVTLSDPGNLTKIGVELTNSLDAWRRNDHKTMVCIHSITALMQYVEVKSVFKFLHEVKNAIDRSNGVAHYHMDPYAHDEETIGKVKQIFDTVIRIDVEENWHVTNREFEVAGNGAIPTLDALD